MGERLRLLYDNNTGIVAQSANIWILHENNLMVIYKCDDEIKFCHKSIVITIYHEECRLSIHGTEYCLKYFDSIIPSTDIDNVKKVYNEMVEFSNYITNAIEDFGYLQIGTNEIQYSGIITHKYKIGKKLRVGNELIDLQVELGERVTVYISFWGVYYENNYFTELVRDLIPSNGNITDQTVNTLRELMLEFINNFNCAVNNYKRVTTKPANNY